MTDNTPPPPPYGVIPYLSVEADAASRFYQKAFAAKELQRMPAEDGKRLMHCCLEINGGMLMMSDAFAEHGHPHVAPAGYVLHLMVDDTRPWWDRAVAAGCEVVMPLEKQFWGDHYGQVRDPFGVTWSIGGPK